MPVFTFNPNITIDASEADCAAACCGIFVECLGYPIPATLYVNADLDCDPTLPAGSEMPMPPIAITYAGSLTWTGSYLGHTFTAAIDGECNLHLTGQYGAWCFDKTLIIAGGGPPFPGASYEENLGSGTSGSDGVVCGDDLSFDPGDCPGGATLSLTVGPTP